MVAKLCILGANIQNEGWYSETLDDALLQLFIHYLTNWYNTNTYNTDIHQIIYIFNLVHNASTEEIIRYTESHHLRAFYNEYNTNITDRHTDFLKEVILHYKQPLEELGLYGLGYYWYRTNNYVDDKGDDYFPPSMSKKIVDIFDNLTSLVSKYDINDYDLDNFVQTSYVFHYAVEHSELVYII